MPQGCVARGRRKAWREPRPPEPAAPSSERADPVAVGSGNGKGAAGLGAAWFGPGHELVGVRVDEGVGAFDGDRAEACFRQTSALIFIDPAVVLDGTPPLEMGPFPANDLERGADRSAVGARRESGAGGDRRECRELVRFFEL